MFNFLKKKEKSKTLENFWSETEGTIILEPKIEYIPSPEIKPVNIENFESDRNELFKLPKFIKYLKSRGSNKYQVGIYSKLTKKTYTPGSYSTLKEAIKARDQFIFENIDTILEGYLPRGIAKGVSKKYSAKFSYQGKYKYLGQFDTIEEAVSTRNNYINSLK